MCGCEIDERGVRVYTCVGTYERRGMDMERRIWEVRVYVVGRHHRRGLSIGVCQKGVVETLGEQPKVKRRICAMELENAEGG